MTEFGATDAVTRMRYQPTFEEDWETVHAPASDAVALLAKRRAAQRMADFADRLSRFTVKLTEHFDWSRLRTNVTHLVEPGLVRWTK